MKKIVFPFITVLIIAFGVVTGGFADQAALGAAQAAEGASGTAITITAGKAVITAVLDDSKTSKDFIKMLPLTILMKRWGDREYYGKLPKALSEEGRQQDYFENGDVAYWPSGGSFALFFNDKVNPKMSSPLVIMGKITSDLGVFENMGEATEMRVELKK